MASRRGSVAGPVVDLVVGQVQVLDGERVARHRATGRKTIVGEVQSGRKRGATTFGLLSEAA